MRRFYLASHGTEWQRAGVSCREMIMMACARHCAKYSRAFHLILPTARWGRNCYCSHVVEEKTEAQGGRSLPNNKMGFSPAWAHGPCQWVLLTSVKHSFQKTLSSSCETALGQLHLNDNTSAHFRSQWKIVHEANFLKCSNQVGSTENRCVTQQRKMPFQTQLWKIEMTLGSNFKKSPRSQHFRGSWSSLSFLTIWIIKAWTSLTSPSSCSSPAQRSGILSFVTSPQTQIYFCESRHIPLHSLPIPPSTVSVPPSCPRHTQKTSPTLPPSLPLPNDSHVHRATKTDKNQLQNKPVATLQSELSKPPLPSKLSLCWASYYLCSAFEWFCHYSAKGWKWGRDGGQCWPAGTKAMLSTSAATRPMWLVTVEMWLVQVEM